MNRTLLVSAALLALSACGPTSSWEPTPGAELRIGTNVTAADPIPAGVECPGIETTNTSLEGRPLYTVISLPTADTVEVRDADVYAAKPRTYDRRCVVAYALSE